MHRDFRLLGAVGVVLATGCALGQAGPGDDPEALRGPVAYRFLRSPADELPESPSYEAMELQPAQQRRLSRRSEPDRIAPRPFSSVGVSLTLGTEGFGVQLATPLNAKWNLRVGGSGFKFNPELSQDGFDIVGDIRIFSVFAGADYHPFFYKFHRLRVSPGATLYNGRRLRANATVPGGQTFDLGYGRFTSDPADPVRGAFNLDFGWRMAPRLTFGVGNLSPRRGQRWSFPFEIGAEYIGKKPQITLDLSGSTCDQGGCSPVKGDREAQADLAQEQINLNNNIPGVLRLLPIVTAGVAYRFGH